MKEGDAEDLLTDSENCVDAHRPGLTAEKAGTGDAAVDTGEFTNEMKARARAAQQRGDLPC